MRPAGMMPAPFFMSDPLQRSPGPDAPLFGSTREIAGQQAAMKSGAMRERILRRLHEQPSTLWEMAEYLGVPDHVISGRFTELAKDLHIERTGERRLKPESQCPADVWRVRGILPGRDPVRSLVNMLGYPDEVTIDGDRYDRQELLPSETYPGIPYARRADTGGARLIVRVQLVECGGCGRPLKFITKGVYRCGTPSCNRTWNPMTIAETGQPPILAMVMKTG